MGAPSRDTLDAKRRRRGRVRITLGVALGVARDDSRGDSRPRGGGRGKRPGNVHLGRGRGRRAGIHRHDRGPRSRDGDARGGFHPRLVLDGRRRASDGVRPVALVHHDVRARGGGARGDARHGERGSGTERGRERDDERGAAGADAHPVGAGGVDDKGRLLARDGDA